MAIELASFDTKLNDDVVENKMKRNKRRTLIMIKPCRSKREVRKVDEKGRIREKV